LGEVNLIRKQVFREVLEIVNGEDDDTYYNMYLLRKKIYEELAKE
jgi:hypothetical protein